MSHLERARGSITSGRTPKPLSNLLSRRQLLCGASAIAVTIALLPRMLLASEPPAPAKPTPPVATKRPERSVHHGIERIDDYAWLRDPDWREAIQRPEKLRPEIREYIDAENAYADAMLAPHAPLQATILAELSGRVEQAQGSVPSRDGPYYYSSRYLPGAEQSQYVRARALDGAVEVLLDADALAKGRSYFSIASLSHSPDHSQIAYTVDTNGAESHDLFVRPIDGTLPPLIIRGVADFVWAADSRSIVYVRRDDDFRPRLVYLHRLGTNPDADAKLYEEADLTFSVSVGRSSTRRHLIMTSSSSDTCEAWLLDPNAPDRSPVVVAPRREGVQYYVDDHGDDLVIRTDTDRAEDFKIVTAPVAAPSDWRDLVAYRENIQVESCVTRNGWMARTERENGLQRIVIRDLKDGSEHTIGFDEEAFALWISQPFEYDEPVIRVGYSSPVTPLKIYDYDMAARTLTLRRQQQVPSGHDPSRYVLRRLQATAADGETIPVTLIHLKELELRGDAPCFISGYGAYAVNTPADFNENAFSLVDRGFVYAKAHVRGGMEKGTRWKEAGRLKNKQNTFTDFIAVTEHMIRLGFTRADRIIAHGASAGGLLVGAVANLRPDLYAGIIAEVPYVDVLTTMLDISLPLTTIERPEWGDPIADADAYRTIASYAPYDNVKAQSYPPLLVTAGIADPRVTYWEPAKWVAKLRATKLGDSPIFLKTKMTAGHSGLPGRFESLEEVALLYAFALDALGLKDARLTTP